MKYVVAFSTSPKGQKVTVYVDRSIWQERQMVKFTGKLTNALSLPDEKAEKLVASLIRDGEGYRSESGVTGRVNEFHTITVAS